MSFSSTSNGYNVCGNTGVETGTFRNTNGSTGGEIKTMLADVDYASVTPVESVSFSAGTLTIVTASNASGYWKVEGI